MSVFDVCAAVSVNGGSSFQWSNSKVYGVKITPVTTWTLPASEYDILPGTTTQPINVPNVSVTTTFQINVKWMAANSPGAPCTTPGANPKIVVNPNQPSFDVIAPAKNAKKAKPRKRKAKAPAKKAKPAKKKSKPPAKKKKATAKKKKKH